MMRAPLPIMFAGIVVLALAGAAGAAPHGASPKTKKDAPAPKMGADVPDRRAAARRSKPQPCCPVAVKKKAPAKTYVVLQLEGDTVIPSMGTTIVKVTPAKRKA